MQQGDRQMRQHLAQRKARTLECLAVERAMQGNLRERGRQANRGVSPYARRKRWCGGMAEQGGGVQGHDHDDRIGAMRTRKRKHVLRAAAGYGQRLVIAFRKQRRMLPPGGPAHVPARLA